MDAQVMHKVERPTGSKDQASYWKGRIKKNCYTTPDGSIRELRDYSIQLTENGVRKTFNLRTPNAEKAAKIARDLHADVMRRGLKEVHLDWTRPKPEGAIKITDFIEWYRQALKEVERQPAPSTVHRYVKDLEKVVKTVKAEHLTDLDPEAIELFKREYRKAARAKGKAEASLNSSMNRILRQAENPFREELLKVYRSRFRLELESPFRGVASAASKPRPYQPMDPKSIDYLWQALPKLRDGDPQAEPPSKANRYVDLTKPNPAAYLIFLLEFGLGLRRNEADKAEWSWVTETNDGAIFTVKQTDYFRPKSGESRSIPLQGPILAELNKHRDSPRFIVKGNDDPPKLGDKMLAKGIKYRCERAHRALVTWLHHNGVDSGKPCHQLRKEFGSYLATTHGLYAAQKLLGHSSPEVTARYYAGLTELPRIDNVRISG